MDVTVVDTIEPLTLPSLPLESIKKLPKLPTVYFVISNNEVLYIGSSCNLNRRWKEHHRYQDFVGLEHVNISWLELCDTNLLQEIELTLIYKFKPRLNLTSSNQTWVDRFEYCSTNQEPSKPNKKIYCRLAVLMAEKNPQLSQRQLARNIGLDITTINRLFTNNFSRVDVNTVEALCNYFDKDVGDLLQMRKPEDIPVRKTRKRSNTEQSPTDTQHK